MSSIRTVRRRLEGDGHTDILTKVLVENPARLLARLTSEQVPNDHPESP
jgi:hypothetical protein